MPITCDWHIHSRNSCDGACMPVDMLLAHARRKGIVDLGLTDHIHTSYNLPDIAASRREFLANNPSERFHFGVEASCMSKWELDEVATGRHDNPVYGLRSGGPPGGPLGLGITADDLRTYGVEYVVAGTHWPMYVPIEPDAVTRDYHRQNMFLATHPLVDIVAHPWWWFKHWADAHGRYTTDPWLDDFGRIPMSMHDEFAAALIEHGTAAEINIEAMLLNRKYTEHFRRQYVEYLAWLKGRGVTLSVGSDCHDDRYASDFEMAAAMLDAVGISDDDLWRLPPRKHT